MRAAVQPLAQRPLRDVEPLARGRDQALDLGHAQKLGQRARPARAFDRQRRIVAPPALGVEKLVKLADRRQAARERRGAQLLRVERAARNPRTCVASAFSASLPLALQISIRSRRDRADRLRSCSRSRRARRRAPRESRRCEKPSASSSPRAIPRPRTGSAAVPRAAARRDRDGGRRAASAVVRAACAARNPAG